MRLGQACAAFYALGPFAKPAIQDLTSLLEKYPGYVPGALAGIGSDAVPELLNGLTNGSFFVRDNTAANLANAVNWGRISSEQVKAAFPVAINNLSYTSANSLFQGNTRWRAAGLIGALKLEPDVSVPALLRALNEAMNGTNDPHLSVAAECVAALGKFGEDARPAVPVLAKAAGSTNRWLRLMAVKALGEIKMEPDISVPALVKSFNEGLNRMTDDPSLAMFSIYALREFGAAASPAVPALTRAANSTNEVLRSTATQALKMIEGQKY